MPQIHSIVEHSRGRRLGLSCGVLLTVLAPLAVLTPHVAWAVPWEDQKGTCLGAFAKPVEAENKLLLGCTDAFATTARLERVSALEKKTIEHGLRWLYENGDDLGSLMARESLLRLDVKVPARAQQATGTATTAQPSDDRKRYDPAEARSADREAADKLVKEAVPLLKKKKWKEGAVVLDKAMLRDPRSESALYNLSCAEANQQDKHKEAIGHLQNLADLGTDDATTRLIKARTDADFEPIRDEAEFKRITGAVRVQVINTIGGSGEQAVENIGKLLVKLDQRKPDQKDDDSAPLDHPQIQFKPHAKAQTALLADLLKHPKVELQPMPADSASKYDIVVRWGAKVTVVDGKKTPDSFGPETVDEEVQAARRKQNKVLAQPEQAVNKVNRVISTPERTYTETENMGKRVGSTVDKAKGSLEKVKGLGDKLNKL